ncbi:MAG TPA: ATP-binding cassette domain-containing protein [Phycisphaerales bacterium]|nr:ATP-binding cassette domain-containing protein [Phycisphaerales bacterium]
MSTPAPTSTSPSNTPTAAPSISAKGLSRHFGTFVAVDNVSFELPSAALVAFLGPNGAGKSTTMRLLTGFLAPSSGTARVCGMDVATDRVGVAKVLGYLPENGPLYPDQTPAEILAFLGGARGLSAGDLRTRIDAVVAQTRLAEVYHKPTGKLSKGFKQRVGMAAALLHDPRVLILDEPTAGLDPNQVDQMRNLLAELAKTKLILLSTHILSEVRALAQRVLVVSRGKLVHDGAGESLGRNEREMEEQFRKLTAAKAA